MGVEMATIAVVGMNCEHCVQTVREALAGVAGVTAVKVDLGRGEAEVKYEAGAVSMGKLMQAVNGAGFTAAGFRRGGAKG